jgi:E3 ubiquitin-protein ligase FANCL
LNIFEIPYFPATDEDTIDCSICLCYRCEYNRCPVVCCENDKCDSTFHISCLEKYLKVQKHVTVLSICIGECPFCKQKLSNSYAPFFQRILEK